MKKTITLLLTLSLLLSLAACGGKEKAPSVDVNALYDSYSELLPEMFYPDDVTLLNFLGIDVEDCAQYKIAICAEGMRADEVWLIEAKDETALETLTQLAQIRIASKLDETVSYAPDQYLIVQKAQVLTNGLYLALLISPDVDTLKAGFEACFQ
ncbi:MAG TPA: hypothetical protein DFH97_07925 [Clostridiales bacterium]|nr:hypothetical protein [Clostridiales bacterium]